jgi:hypothetical protein
MQGPGWAVPEPSQPTPTVPPALKNGGSNTYDDGGHWLLPIDAGARRLVKDEELEEAAVVAVPRQSG